MTTVTTDRRTAPRGTLLGAVCAALWISVAWAPASAAAQVTAALCGRIGGGQSGPWDYRSERWDLNSRVFLKGMLANVEFNHFPPNTEMLIRPKFYKFIDDIGYTLERWPNHHRALVTLMRLTERLNTDYPEKATLPAECWFERATRFAPDDTVVRGLYADFLRQRKRDADAVEQLRQMERHGAGSAMTHYNLALIYLDLKRPQDALGQAHKALAAGHPNLGAVRKRLEDAGQWREPVDADAPASAASAASSAENATPAVQVTTNPRNQ